jgi:hypothetical protein
MGTLKLKDIRLKLSIISIRERPIVMSEKSCPKRKLGHFACIAPVYSHSRMFSYQRSMMVSPLHVLHKTKNND